MSDQEVKAKLPTIDNSPLNADDDWTDVVEALDRLKSEWKQVGMKLRINASKLSEIEGNNPRNIGECMSQMLLEWLNKNYNTSRFGDPSWRLLADAVWKLNRDVFRAIADEHGLQGGNGAQYMAPAQTRVPKGGIMQQRPTMKNLSLVKATTPNGVKRVRLLDTVANKWREIGRAMGIEDAALEGWEDQYKRNTDRVNAVFSRFMANGCQGYEFTYDGVVELLEDVGGFDNLVQDFKETLMAN